nr:RING/FYVE/PHD zinc finger superfamily protein, putative isoform 1 [Ipomoea batatas]
MLPLFYAAAPLMLCVPPVRSLTLFVGSVEKLLRGGAAVYTRRLAAHLHRALSRYLFPAF